MKFNRTYVLGILWGIAILWTSCTQEPSLVILPENQRLVDAELFVKKTLSSDQVFIDCRPSSNFLDGHLPGAVNIWRDELTDSIGIMLPRDQIAHIIGTKGLSADGAWILYDDRGSCEAARLWWVLTYYGFDRVYILNGGIDYWKHLHLLIESGESTKAPTLFEFKHPINQSLSIDHDQLLVEQGSGIKLIDTRSAKEFDGSEQKEGALYAGHIPGSIHIDYTESVHIDSPHDKRFKSKAELLRLFQDAGITTEDQIVTYCHSGTRSAHTTFVLKELLGFKHVRNYDGSWMEWTRKHPSGIKKAG